MLFENPLLEILGVNDNETGNQEKDIAYKDIKSTNGKMYPVEKLMCNLFMHLRSHMTAFLQKQGIEAKPQEIKWIIAVPFNLSDQSKNIMKQWMIRSGAIDDNIKNQLKIVHETECAALSIQKYPNIVDGANAGDEKKEKSNIQLRNGNKYLLLNADTDTSTMYCLEVLKRFKTRIIESPITKSMGANHIDDIFFKALTDIFNQSQDQEWVNEFKQQYPKSYEELLHNLQEAKITFYGKPGRDHHNIRLPMDFVEFMHERLSGNSAEMEAIVANSDLGKCGSIHLGEEYLSVNTKLWSQWFDEIIDPMINEMKKMLDSTESMEDCKYLCFVGELASSPYACWKIQAEFGMKSKYKLPFVIPNKEPSLSVVRGAAFIGFNKKQKAKDKYGYKIHIAIDFGTDGIGLAYAYGGTVSVHQPFRSKRYGATVKPKTIVLLKGNGDVKSIGIDAKFTYVTLTIFMS